MNEFIGVDLGGTKIFGVALNDNFEILSSKRVLTGDVNDLSSIIEKVINLINELKTENTKSVGFGVAGFVDFKNGIIHGSPNIPALKEVNLKEIVERETGLYTFIDNDAKTGALAELYVGSDKNLKDFLFIAFGTGIGSAIVTNGSIVRGKDNLAGEIGHITLDPNGPLCTCGKYGCFEAFASGPSIRRIYLERINKTTKSPLLESINYNFDLIDTPLIFEFINTDPIAKEVLYETAMHIGHGLSIVVNLLNPEKIIIGGGMGQSLKLIFNDIMDSFYKNTLKIPGKSVQFEFSTLGNVGVALGSGILASINI
ncbi:ROK family protein [Caldisericum exile]|uniref:Glucokinase n=1 Tax=Caldisericum exile (strain DSM 21853 / NBRC 104410 / AZM16c01) TaxID=511051 RepID=A0A7U6GF21_CALEA|nr:ROK family protein [Caldisericum exile]BAL81132.1 glucokinase [Caldisericum exile AZM16c01]